MTSEIFTRLLGDIISEFGADMASEPSTTVIKFGNSPESAAKHRVSYSIRNRTGSFQAMVTETFDNDVKGEYSSWCVQLEKKLAQVHEVSQRDIQLHMVWNL